MPINDEVIAAAEEQVPKSILELYKILVEEIALFNQDLFGLLGFAYIAPPQSDSAVESLTPQLYTLPFGSMTHFKNVKILLPFTIRSRSLNDIMHFNELKKNEIPVPHLRISPIRNKNTRNKRRPSISGKALKTADKRQINEFDRFYFQFKDHSKENLVYVNTISLLGSPIVVCYLGQEIDNKELFISQLEKSILSFYCISMAEKANQLIKSQEINPQKSQKEFLDEMILFLCPAQYQTTKITYFHDFPNLKTLTIKIPNLELDIKYVELSPINDILLGQIKKLLENLAKLVFSSKNKQAELQEKIVLLTNASGQLKNIENIWSSINKLRNILISTNREKHQQILNVFGTKFRSSNLREMEQALLTGGTQLCTEIQVQKSASTVDVLLCDSSELAAELKKISSNNSIIYEENICHFMDLIFKQNSSEEIAYLTFLKRTIKALFDKPEYWYQALDHNTRLFFTEIIQGFMIDILVCIKNNGSDKMNFMPLLHVAVRELNAKTSLSILSKIKKISIKKASASSYIDVGFSVVENHANLQFSVFYFILSLGLLAYLSGGKDLGEITWKLEVKEGENSNKKILSNTIQYSNNLENNCLRYHTVSALLEGQSQETDGKKEFAYWLSCVHKIFEVIGVVGEPADFTSNTVSYALVLEE